jgi:hypothetical protein
MTPYFFNQAQEKVLYINFKQKNNCLSFQEKIIYTELKDIHDQCSFSAKPDNYLCWRLPQAESQAEQVISQV